MKHFKKVIVLGGSIAVLCFAFQNCGQGFTSISGGATELNSGSGNDTGRGAPGSPGSPGAPVSPGPVAGLDTQQIPVASLQTVDSVKVLIAVDNYTSQTSSMVLLKAKISELLQGLKGKHAVIGLITTGTYNSMSATQFFVPDNGDTSIDLTKPVAKMALVNYVLSSSPSQPPNFDALVPLLGRQVLAQSNALPQPKTVYSVTPGNSDADLAALAQQMQSDLGKFVPDIRKSSLCILSRFFGDDSANSFFKTTDAVSALLLSDVDDGSSIASDCIKQTNQVQNVIRSRTFTGQQKMSYYSYTNDQKIQIAQYSSIASDWVLGADCSAKDLAANQAKYPGTTVFCHYVSSSINLSSLSVSNMDDDLCVTPFTLNGVSFKNAVDYFHRVSTTATDACVVGSFVYSLAAINPTAPANLSPYYFITDLQALQNQNVPLGLSQLAKARFPAATINSVIHLQNESCALPAGQTYATKIASLTGLMPNATSASLCGNSYTTAFAKTSGTSGGTQKEITVSLSRNSNEIIAGVYIQKKSGQTLVVPSYSLAFQGDSMTMTSPLLESGDIILVQYKPL